MDWVIYLLVFLVSVQCSVMFEACRRLIRAERIARQNNVAWASVEACKMADVLVENVDRSRRLVDVLEKTVERVDALESKGRTRP